jgi:hypothetical protein
MAHLHPAPLGHQRFGRNDVPTADVEMQVVAVFFQHHGEGAGNARASRTMAARAAPPGPASFETAGESRPLRMREPRGITLHPG